MCFFFQKRDTENVPSKMLASFSYHTSQFWQFLFKTACTQVNKRNRIFGCSAFQYLESKQTDSGQEILKICLLILHCVTQILSRVLWFHKHERENHEEPHQQFSWYIPLYNQSNIKMALDSSSDPFAKMLTVLVLEISSVFSLFSHQVEESNSVERLVLIITSIAMLLVSLFLLYHIIFE